MPVHQRLEQCGVPVLVYTDEADAVTLEQLGPLCGTDHGFGRATKQ